MLLTETVRATGLDRALNAAVSPWRKPLAIHDPAKVVTDLALALALGGPEGLEPPTSEPPTSTGEGSEPTAGRGARLTEVSPSVGLCAAMSPTVLATSWRVKTHGNP